MVRGDIGVAPVDGVRRSAMYALAAAGDAAVPVLLEVLATHQASPPPAAQGPLPRLRLGKEAITSERAPVACKSAQVSAATAAMELRACSVFALGQCAQGHSSSSLGAGMAVVDALAHALQNDASSFVRSTAAHALGFVGRRAAALKDGDAMTTRVCEALCTCLSRSASLIGELSPWQVDPRSPAAAGSSDSRYGSHGDGGDTATWSKILSVCSSRKQLSLRPPSKGGVELRGASADFFEGSHGGSEADIYARSGMREHAAQVRTFIYIQTCIIYYPKSIPNTTVVQCC